MDIPVLVDKPLGATPLETLNLLRVACPQYADAKLAYAGRLDPMATGLLVVLHGDLLSVQERFWHLTKSYDAEVVLGISSDSYDLLGFAQAAPSAEPALSDILAAAQALVGKSHRPVPPYSSIVHGGKPLFMHARGGTVPARVPVRPMAVSEVTVRDVGTLSSGELLERAEALVSRVHGDFRQSETLERWRLLAARHREASWPRVRLGISCSAGTYIRSLAHEFGSRLGTGGILAALRRTGAGPWSVSDDAVVRFS